MKPGASSLNPYAAAYVPLFKRGGWGGVDGNKEFNSAQNLNSGNEAVWFGHQPDHRVPQGHHHNVSQSYVRSPGALRTAAFSKWKDHHGGDFSASTSQYQNEIPERSNFDEEFDMDLAFLQMNFPGISDESLSDVYLANRCDLDASLDMLNQLEVLPSDSSDKLPDTLDIGDVPEPAPVAQPKATNAGSTSASSN